MAEAVERNDLTDFYQRKKVREPLRLNWRLWTIFQAQLTVGESENVPDDVRTNMLTLCKFVDKHTVSALTDPTPEKVSVLVDMNRNIASGLLASVEATAQASEQGGEGDQAADVVREQAEAISRINAQV